MSDADPRPPRLYYFRHGETDWSLSRRHTGRTEQILTPHGRDQARALRPRVEALAFSSVLVSPRLRARETCELAGASRQSEIEPEAAEWDYGDYEGLRTQDIRRDRPDWDIYRDGCPGGETPVDVGARADRLIARILMMRGDVALFSHGQFGLVLAARWIGLEVTWARHLSIDPASMGLLRFDPDHPETPVIALWNMPSGMV